MCKLRYSHLIHSAHLVPWNVIIRNRSAINQLVDEDDVAVYRKYVPAELVKSLFTISQQASSYQNELILLMA